MNVKNLLVVGGAALSLALVGCEDKKNPIAGVTNTVKDGAKAAGDAAAKGVDAAKDAGKAAVDTAKDAGKAAADTAKDAGKAIADKSKELMAEGGKWLTDTVEKQWPAAKSTLDDLTKKASGLTDASLKTKVTDAITGLKNQIPEMETLVGKLKNFTGTDGYGTLFTQVKDKFAGFMKKLDEVKGMLPK